MLANHSALHTRPANLYMHVWECAKLTLLHAEIDFVFSAVFNFVL